MPWQPHRVPRVPPCRFQGRSLPEEVLEDTCIVYNYMHLIIILYYYCRFYEFWTGSPIGPGIIHHVRTFCAHTAQVSTLDEASLCSHVLLQVSPGSRKMRL